MLRANWDVWELFQAVDTQWRVGAMGAVGLDYPAVQWVAERLEIAVDRCCLRKLGMLEKMVLARVRPKEGAGDAEGVRPDHGHP